ncbi:ABC-2 type transport system ATP-binding protein [Lactobacillus colini]|uniref:ABC-2 type transport system ATP-binding protein n=1 Tax=Lactobacillus colini TaxID=1819254 RepID=A0ABS4MFT7_9LACO|nr:AAA family ATPase [Lactobacillus colini]MBP2058557.1 ABC-2 type transport system ATP-binding protein [Lactobacillus colini]
MIELKDVTVAYDEKKVLDCFTGNFEFGRLNVLIGKNGIGKSTLLDVISHLTQVDAGVLKNIPKASKIMYMFQNTPFNTNVTVKQLFNMYRSFSKVTTFKYYDISNMDIFFEKNILPIFNRNLGSLSGGESKLIFTYVSAMVLKELYLFDEPLSGVDIENRTKIIELLGSLGKHVPVIMTSHEIEVFKGTDSILKYISPKGFLFTGTYEQLIKQYGPTSEDAFLNLTRKMKNYDDYVC